jgi:hypothetical protein
MLDDPEQLVLACRPILAYAEAFRAYKRASKIELKVWQGDPMMARVEEIDFELRRAEMEKGR